jgi:hypothetical protein
MDKTVAIVGGGQIGRRYLQGALQLPDKLHLFVVDPNKESRLACLDFVQEFNSNFQHLVSVVQDLTELPDSIDVCIVATQSSQRLDIVKELNESNVVKYWILEKLLAENPAKVNEIGDIFAGSNNVWVNTLRRATPLYKNLKHVIGNPENISLKVVGGSWGIASNAIHFVDLMCYLAGDLNLEIYSRCEQDCMWVPSQRPEILELIGTMIVRLGENKTLEMISSQGNSPLAITIEEGPNPNFWVVNEEAGIISGHTEIQGRLLLQSEITSIILSDIFENGRCDLTPIKHSLQQHNSVMNEFAANWHQNHSWDGFPPIT